MNQEIIAIAQRCFEREAVSTERDMHARTVRRRIDYHLLPQLRQHASSGDEVLQKLNAALDKFGYARSKVQRQLHHSFLNAVCPFIYGDELQLCSDRVLAEHSWTDWRLQTLALTPRRFGKTTAVSMFCAGTPPHWLTFCYAHPYVSLLPVRAGVSNCGVQYGCARAYAVQTQHIESRRVQGDGPRRCC